MRKTKGKKPLSSVHAQRKRAARPDRNAPRRLSNVHIVQSVISDGTIKEDEDLNDPFCTATIGVMVYADDLTCDSEKCTMWEQEVRRYEDTRRSRTSKYCRGHSSGVFRTAFSPFLVDSNTQQEESKRLY